VSAVLCRSEATARALGRAVLFASEKQDTSDEELRCRLLGELERSDEGVLRPRGAVGPDLSVRERHVLARLSEGRGTAEIATELEISERTVKKHLHALQGRLMLRNRAHAIAYAIRGGLL
jgi:DNA-binding NarL/FixJ family response regulator